MPLKPSTTPPPIITLDEAGVHQLASDLAKTPAGNGQRKTLALAGLPGSGKSTLAKRLTDTINQVQPGHAMLFAMDGFHMSNDKLVRLGLRNRKGAPQTFEAQRYIKMLTELRDATRRVSVPIYDRTVEEPVFTGKPEHTATEKTRCIITEGNYLLLESLPWSEIAELSDLTVWLDTPTDQARQWVIERHIRFGRSREDAEMWYESNDKLNAQHILDHSRHADRIARWPL